MPTQHGGSSTRKTEKIIKQKRAKTPDTYDDKTFTAIPSNLTFTITPITISGMSGATAYGVNNATTPDVALLKWSSTQGGTVYAGYRWNTSSSTLLSYGTYQVFPYGISSSSSSAALLVGGINSGSSSFPNPFTWTAAGGFTLLNGLGGYQTIAYDQAYDGSGNNIVCGWSYSSTLNAFQAVRWINSTTAGFLDFFGTLTHESKAYAVNTQGTVVGYSYIDTAGVYHAFRIPRIDSSLDSAFHELGSIKGNTGKSEASDINDQNEAVRLSDVVVGGSTQTHGFWRGPSTVPNSGFLDLGSLLAYGINNNGHFVGKSGTVATIRFNDGMTKNLAIFETGVKGNVSNLTGWSTLSEVTKINNAGYMIGLGTYNGSATPFLLAPSASY